MQIIKHALEYYIQRPDVSEESLKQESQVLKQITQEVEDIKKVYKIVNKIYKVIHVSGVECVVEANGERHARKKAFVNFQEIKGDYDYEKFIKEIIIEEVYE